jgi:ribosomal-protein-alanine N-acetyltransferase
MSISRYIRDVFSATPFPFQFPELKTERTNLVWLSAKDRAFVHRLFADKQVQEFRGAPQFSKMEEAEELLWRWRKKFAAGDGIRWGIFHREGQSLIGTAGIKHIDYEHKRGEISYELIPGWWNRGIMTEVLMKICSYAMNELQLHSLQANIDPRHDASRRVLEKLDFKNEAHFRENWFHEGWWDSSIWVKR